MARAKPQPKTKPDSAAARRRATRRTRLRKRYGAIAKTDYIAMADRETKTLHEQADQYGLPLRGAVLDLPAIVKAFHDLLAKIAPHYTKWFGGLDEDAMLGGPVSPALEKYREESWRLKRLERLERQGQLVSRVVIHERLGTLAAALRDAGQRLQREHGDAAWHIVQDVLDSMTTEIRKMDVEVRGNTE